MTTSLTVYVGPYIQVMDSNFKWEEFDDVVMRGRESREGEPLILIPNVELSTPDTNREFEFDRVSENSLTPISEENMRDEIWELTSMTKLMLEKLNLDRIDWNVPWGVVPYWY